MRKFFHKINSGKNSGMNSWMDSMLDSMFGFRVLNSDQFQAVQKRKFNNPKKTQKQNERNFFSHNGINGMKLNGNGTEFIHLQRIFLYKV